MKKFIIAAALLPAIAFAKPSSVECIAPAGAGGGWDFTCRIPAAQVMQKLGLVDGAIEVTNMAGAGGAKAYAHVVNDRKGDAKVIVAASMATAVRLAQNAYPGSKVSDVRWLGSLASDFGVIAVRKDSPYQNLTQFMEGLEKNPAKNFVVGGSPAGGWDHLKVLLVAEKAGIKQLKTINYVAFDNGGKAMLEVISGRAAAFTGDTSEVLSYVDAGQVRVLGVLSPQRIARLGDTKTAKEQGYDVIGANWRGYFAAPGIPAATYNEWVEIIQKVAASSEWKKLRDDNGLAEFNVLGPDFEKFVVDQVNKVSLISSELGFMSK